MNDVTFTLPTVPSADMSTNDQGALMVNQATAVIISEWLAHANVILEKYDSTTFPSVSSTNYHHFIVQPAQLISIINDVQNALRSF